ncbi:hypothetical protein [Sulfitobacter sp. R18_1]|uniref:hypothetical protein n=1 Tax=Sulfitobacter sp. R18_1 TaxID=2821104 RepID=UPI001ADC454B|nr:hypothetical protein [Sulfitobacter sp. R18_1]MBO9428690.1 hypothetical protein [Sulfitobacter sp. R18_1]
MMTDPHQLEIFAFYVHEFLVDHWVDHWIEHRKITGEEVPDIPSTHLCRESSAFTLFLLEILGQSGWSLEFGQLPFDEDDDIPLDITDVDGDGIRDEDIISAPHVWLNHDKTGYNIDVTANQFGRLLTPTGEGPLISHDSERIYTLSDEPQDWSNDPEIVLAAEKWMLSPKIEELLEDVREALGVSPEIKREPSSVAPPRVRDALRRVQEEALSACRPTSPEEAFEMIGLHERITKAYDLTPRYRARDEALSTLDAVSGYISTNWKPATEDERQLKEEILLEVRSLVFPVVGNKDNSSCVTP